MRSLPELGRMPYDTVFSSVLILRPNSMPRRPAGLANLPNEQKGAGYFHAVFGPEIDWICIEVAACDRIVPQGGGQS